MHLGSLMKTDTCHFSSSHLTLYTFKICPWKEKPAVKFRCLREFPCVGLTRQILFPLSFYIKGKSEALQCWAETQLGESLMVEAIGGEPQFYNLMYIPVGWLVWCDLPIRYSPALTGSQGSLVLWTYTDWLIDAFLLTGVAQTRNLH